MVMVNGRLSLGFALYEPYAPGDFRQVSTDHPAA